MSADTSPAMKRANHCFFFCSRSEDQNRHLHAPDLSAHREEQTVIFTAIAQRFHGENHFEHVAVATAVLSRQGRPKIPNPAHFFQASAGMAAPISLVASWIHLLASKLANRIHESRLFLC